MKNFLKKLISVGIGLLIAFALCEAILRIYNPYQSRIRGNEIMLKSNYSKTLLIDPPIKGLSQKVKYSTNSIGFRGPEPPGNWDEHTTLFTIGGSTTECSKLSDDSTWTALMHQNLKPEFPDLWINNAGIDGCSTYGHIILMRDYIIDLKPDYVLFMFGVNDLGKATFESEDGFLMDRDEPWWRSVLKKSELLTTVSNVLEALKAKSVNLEHGNDPYAYKTSSYNTATGKKKEKIIRQFKEALPGYRNRIETLHRLCADNGIQPVFATQPIFDAEGTLSWEWMLKYNDALIAYCRENRLPVIDLGRALPKDIRYYYDTVHYTKAGARKVADILAAELRKILEKRRAAGRAR